MGTTGLRIGIVGCGPAATARVDGLLAIEGVEVVGYADADLAAARALAGRVPSGTALAFEDHAELLRQATPDALVVSSPNRTHYRAAMDGLQAGCHLLLTTSLSASVQEAVDIVGLARARNRKVSLGHGFRRSPSLARARGLVAEGAIGGLRLVTSTLAMPRPGGPAPSDPKASQGGVFDELGVDWFDALLWACGRPAELVCAARTLDESGRDLATAASLRLGGGVLASVAISGVAHAPLAEWAFHGDLGRLRATGETLVLEEGGAAQGRPISLIAAELDPEAGFVSAIREGSPLGCPASEGLDAVRVLEAIVRSAAIGQSVELA